MRPVLTIRLFSEEKCFGPGIAELLERVEERRSLRAAAASMDMAYSKAWTIVRRCEENLGMKLLDYTTGGKNGGALFVKGQTAMRVTGDLAEHLIKAARRIAETK